MDSGESVAVVPRRALSARQVRWTSMAKDMTARPSVGASVGVVVGVVGWGTLASAGPVAAVVAASVPASLSRSRGGPWREHPARSAASAHGRSRVIMMSPSGIHRSEERRFGEVRVEVGFALRRWFSRPIGDRGCVSFGKPSRELRRRGRTGGWRAASVRRRRAKRPRREPRRMQGRRMVARAQSPPHPAGRARRRRQCRRRRAGATLRGRSHSGRRCRRDARP